jgi:hypothetical protein
MDSNVVSGLKTKPHTLADEPEHRNRQHLFRAAGAPNNDRFVPFSRQDQHDKSSWFGPRLMSKEANDRQRPCAHHRQGDQADPKIGPAAEILPSLFHDPLRALAAVRRLPAPDHKVVIDSS